MCIRDRKETVEASDEKSEQEEYSDSVQKRINKLTYKLRETERQNEEALTWAKKFKTRTLNLRKKQTLLTMQCLLSMTAESKQN